MCRGEVSGEKTERMIHFDLPKEKSSIIKVIGIGGGGSNAVNYMHSQGIEGVNFIICNTDAQAITNSKVPNKIQLGPHLTQGLGAGANPEIGRQATEESMEEIRRILEVNTKMAFITAGMGGGTGTGGAPIIAKVCKDMDILTVGIVTTPFSYEGKKRILQGEDGINRLKENVDTLLVISNDKLRHQYGNLKMKEAFAKADNILATAAKCITDVINSTGQINVDFADVCTVMRNGGVAILGSGSAEGENRAQRAIEQALNSPLLNDNDIRGAKWILININSCEGEHEFTMDEVDIIQSHLLSQAGPNTDVIMGLGYDANLGSKIGITLIATGFEHRDPFVDEKAKFNPQPQKEEKIVMTLGQPEEEKRLYNQPALFPDEEMGQPSTTPQEPIDAMAPTLVEPVAPVVGTNRPEPPVTEERFVLEMPGLESEPPAPLPTGNGAASGNGSSSAAGNGPFMTAGNSPSSASVTGPSSASGSAPSSTGRPGATPSDIGSRKFLSRPSNIYDDNSEKKDDKPLRMVLPKDETPGFDMQLVIKDDVRPGTPSDARPESRPDVRPEVRPEMRPDVRPEMRPDARPEMRPDARPDTRQDIRPEARPDARPEMRPDARPDVRPDARPEVRPDARADRGAKVPPVSAEPMAPAAAGEEADEQRKKAAERLQKLRNLSFNVNAQDATNEFEAIPAYMRRNMELYNTVNSIENFYSNYTVKPSDNKQAEISTINTFLDGKKPD